MNNGIWATLSHSKIFFRGLGLVLHRKQTTKQPTQPNCPQTPYPRMPGTINTTTWLVATRWGNNLFTAAVHHPPTHSSSWRHFSYKYPVARVRSDSYTLPMSFLACTYHTKTRHRNTQQVLHQPAASYYTTLEYRVLVSCLVLVGSKFNEVWAPRDLASSSVSVV